MIEKIHTYDIGYNLFNYAYKELSQDAVICWLIKWAYYDKPVVVSGISGPRYDRLRKCGKEFIEALFDKHNKKVPENIINDQVKIWQQDNNIDVLARIGEYVLLIEDKKGSGDHSDQLERYYQLVVDGMSAAGEVSGEDFILPIYLKTETQSLFDVLRIENSTKYKVFDRTDFLDVIEPFDTAHPILSDFTSYLKYIEEDTQSYKEWREGGKVIESYRSWQGFYRELENHLVAFDRDNSETGFGNGYGYKCSSVGGSWKHGWEKDKPWGWNWVNNPSGGFAGFWWYYKWVKSCDCDVRLYLQLELKLDNLLDSKLCFKTSSNKKDRNIAQDIQKRILESGGKLVCTPYRMRAGYTTTIAQWDDQYKDGENQNPWLVFNQTDNRLDILATIKNLTRAQSILDRVQDIM